MHQNTYNDATFVTSFWSALWLVWLAFNGNREAAKVHAMALASMIVGMTFLSGFVGKLTPEYLSGEVIRNIFAVWGKQSPVNILLNNSELGAPAAAFITKVIILCEGALALNLVIFKRQLWIFSLCVIPMLMLFSTWRILSVTSSLTGLLFAALWISAKSFVKEL